MKRNYTCFANKTSIVLYPIGFVKLKTLVEPMKQQVYVALSSTFLKQRDPNYERHAKVVRPKPSPYISWQQANVGGSESSIRAYITNSFLTIRTTIIQAHVLQEI